MNQILLRVLKLSAPVLLLVLLTPAYSQVQKKPVKVTAGEKAIPQKVQTMQTYKKAPQATIDLIRDMARPLSNEEEMVLKSILLPPAVDYSSKVTLVRDQNGTSCCCEYTAAAFVDVLKEMERPYTPDVSVGFINYCYQASIGWYPNDSRINIPGEGQMGVVKYLGAVPEAFLSSRNYDPYNTGRTPTAEEIPSARDLQVAPLLKVKDIQVKYFKTTDGLDKIKAYLCSGPVGVLQGGHCMLLIGYDDSKSEFTLQNSYAETGVNRGFVTWTYNDMLNNMHRVTDGKHDMSVTIVRNDPTPANAYVYVARIKAKTPAGRNDLVLKIGVEGHAPLIVWSAAPHGAIDRGLALTYDVPLPDYAAQHRPPDEQNPWYLEASYGINPGGIIEDVVLVKRGFKSDGTPLSTLYRPSSTAFSIPQNATEKIYIPSKISKQLLLSANPVKVEQAKRVTFTCTLLTHAASSSSKSTVIPVKNTEVAIWQVKSDPIEQTIQEKLIGKCTTENTGKCSLSFAPEKSAQYQAYATDEAGNMIAVSNIITVSVNKSFSPSETVKPGIVAPVKSNEKIKSIKK